MPISVQAAPASYEAFRQPGVLAGLRAASRTIRALAGKNYALLKENPQHPSLHFKKIDRFWSVRIGCVIARSRLRRTIRLVWFWIGSHADYDSLIR